MGRPYVVLARMSEAIFFDDSEMCDEDELLWANNGEGFSHDPGPRDVPVRLLPVRDRAFEPQLNPPGRNVRIRAMPEHLADPQRMIRKWLGGKKMQLRHTIRHSWRPEGKRSQRIYPVRPKTDHLAR